jgi:uncharacterized hydantoinase/oxoprolinase family protein
LTLLGQSVRHVVAAMPKPPDVVILSGEGEFLGRRLLADLAMNVHTISLTDALGSDVSRAAPAHALAVLAREHTEVRG